MSVVDLERGLGGGVDLRVVRDRLVDDRELDVRARQPDGVVRRLEPLDARREELDERSALVRRLRRAAGDLHRRLARAARLLAARRRAAGAARGLRRGCAERPARGRRGRAARGRTVRRHRRRTERARVLASVARGERRRRHAAHRGLGAGQGRRRDARAALGLALRRSAAAAAAPRSGGGIERGGSPAPATARATARSPACRSRGPRRRSRTESGCDSDGLALAGASCLCRTSLSFAASLRVSRWASIDQFSPVIARSLSTEPRSPSSNSMSMPSVTSSTLAGHRLDVLEIDRLDRGPDATLGGYVLAGIRTATSRRLRRAAFAFHARHGRMECERVLGLFRPDRAYLQAEAAPFEEQPAAQRSSPTSALFWQRTRVSAFFGSQPSCRARSTCRRPSRRTRRTGRDSRSASGCSRPRTCRAGRSRRRCALHVMRSSLSPGHTMRVAAAVLPVELALAGVRVGERVASRRARASASASGRRRVDAYVRRTEGRLRVEACRPTPRGPRRSR